MAAFRSTTVVRSGLQNILKKRPDDVVFTTALRTPIARLGKGFKHAVSLEFFVYGCS
jgi:acetyl-CoA acyltransferase 1